MVGPRRKEGAGRQPRGFEWPHIRTSFVSSNDTHRLHRSGPSTGRSSPTNASKNRRRTIRRKLGTKPDRLPRNGSDHFQQRPRTREKVTRQRCEGWRLCDVASEVRQSIESDRQGRRISNRRSTDRWTASIRDTNWSVDVGGAGGVEEGKERCAANLGRGWRGKGEGGEKRRGESVKRREKWKMVTEGPRRSGLGDNAWPNRAGSISDAAMCHQTVIGDLRSF